MYLSYLNTFVGCVIHKILKYFEVHVVRPVRIHGPLLCIFFRTSCMTMRAAFIVLNGVRGRSARNVLLLCGFLWKAYAS